MGREKILEMLNSYDKNKIKIATLGSHSALNILRGAKDEGFETICICRDNEKIIYNSFDVADSFISINDFSDLLDKNLQNQLIDNNAILIPHGSFNAYIGNLNNLVVPVFGNRELMLWETDRERQRKWLLDANLKLPETYEKPEDINGLVIVKYPGAKGGMGYFLATDEEDFYSKSEKMIEKGFISREEIKNAHIQKYIVGANIYFSFFYSPVFNRVELIATDRRYESNADGIGRIPADLQLKIDLLLSYTVMGNFPVVLRESLLVQALNAAQRVVEVSKKIAYPGMVGPFCLEAVFDENNVMTVFEISARIVAGTTVGIPASPYSYLLFGENMYMGRRIAREVRLAVEKDMLDSVIY
jgi:5-formaminoimidazole-4-carboxamide-1-(beta)-D-ribofuranosyl 5'-monophosphate synthetase